MSSTVAEVADVIRRGSSFLLTCHLLPDADAAGSMLGLAGVLRAMGKQVYLYNRDPMPAQLAFLDGIDDVHTTVPAGATFDGTLVTDTAARNLLPRNFPPSDATGPVIIIDHHLAHDDYGDIVLRDPTACATAMVVLQLARELGVTDLNVETARPLYTAIVADTGGFRYPGTTPDTLRTAADLLETGFDPWVVASNVFENWPMSRLRLLGYAINAMETEFAGRVALLCIPPTMVERAGASERMVEGMVEYGRMLSGVEISAMLWERRQHADETTNGPVVTRISLRSSSKGVDVAALATALGGGGHRNAAGATLPCGLREARDRVLQEAGRLLGIA